MGLYQDDRSVCADEIVHGFTVPALDLEAFAGTKSVLLDLLQQPSTPHAPHLEPADLGDVMVFGLLLREQKHGGLVSPSSLCLSDGER
jgi:hypothetical protein